MSLPKRVVDSVRRRAGAEAYGKGATFFLLSSTVVNVSSFLFHMASSRLLGPTDYGSLSTLINMTNLIALPVGALQFAVTQAVLEKSREGHRSITRLLRRTGLIGVLIVLAIFVFLSPIDSYFHMTSIWPMVFVALWIPFALLSTLVQGVLLGEFKYSPVATGILVGGGLLRLVIGVLLIYVRFGVTGATIALLAGQIFTFLYVLFSARHFLARTPETSHLMVGFRHISISIATFTGLTAFTAVDTFLSRHYFSPFYAGQYAAASIAAHVALFFPSAVVMVSFPHMVGEREISESSRQLILQSLKMTTVLGVAVGVVFAISPHLVTEFLFGSKFAPASTILRVLLVQSVGLGVLTLLVAIQLARRHWTSLLPLLGVGVAVLATALHPTSFGGLADLMLVVTAIVVAVIGGSLGLAIRASSRRQRVAVTN